jgi:hypothetical protein
MTTVASAGAYLHSKPILTKLKRHILIELRYPTQGSLSLNGRHWITLKLDWIVPALRETFHFFQNFDEPLERRRDHCLFGAASFLMQPLNRLSVCEFHQVSIGVAQHREIPDAAARLCGWHDKYP